MKNSKVCPKCGSNDIVRFDGNIGALGKGNNVLTGTTVYSAIDVNRYVCCSCGYTEEWIDKKDLETVKNGKRAKEV